ncbi:MAG: phosphatase PAP2 family protein [bacterium]
MAIDAVCISTGVIFHNVQINENHPLISSDIKVYRNESIPAWALAAVHAGYSLTPFLLVPADALRHFRGAWFAASVNYALYSTTASLAGRKRPNYDDALARGEKAEKRSFYSGHTMSSFCSAAYMSLYIKDHIKSRPLKIILPAVMFSYAGYVGYTRYNEHFHHISDVLAGGAAGALVTWYCYNLFQNKNRKVELSADLNSVKLIYKLF